MADTARAVPDLSSIGDIPAAARAFPRPAGVKLSYGVAGFRGCAAALDSTLLRAGLVAAARARTLGLAVGLMVTASHNPEADNGVKLVDPDGGMLAQAWEAHAQALADAAEEDVAAAFERVLAARDVGGTHRGLAPDAGKAGPLAPPQPLVFLAWDTRPSSPRLAALAEKGVGLGGVRTERCGQLTTPQLHHWVRMANGFAGAGPFFGKAAWAGEDGYYAMLADAYAALVGEVPTPADGPAGAVRAPEAVAVDAASGVGGPKANALAGVLRARLGNGAPAMRVVNGPGDGELNAGCGAEHVQKARLPPRGLASPGDLGGAVRACSLDGDADRVVFFYFRTQEARPPTSAPEPTPTLSCGSARAEVGTASAGAGAPAAEWRLLDGDKVAALLAGFLRDHLRIALGGASVPAGGDADAEPLRAAVVQTAYANGASTRFLEAAGIHVAVAKTGVKHLHHRALDYDLGVYFEANGHGTVLFSDRLTATLEGVAQADAEAPEAKASARVLLAMRQLINQAVGDALSDLLAVDVVLRRRAWGFPEWDALYEDLPSRQTKLRVADRTVVTCSDDETRVLRPPELQAALDSLMGAVDGGRCFARPSGTEDVVRIYAEATTQEAADQLALDAAVAVYELAGGVGEKPKEFAA